MRDALGRSRRSLRMRSATSAKALAACSVMSPIGAAGLEARQVGEGAAQQLTLGRVAKLLECEAVGLGRAAGELGVDFEGQPVADDEQRRVIERVGVVLELAQRIVEIAARRLVFHAKQPRLNTSAKPRFWPSLSVPFSKV